MADSVLSVRIDEELKQRFIEIAQENEVNNKDLMQMLVAHFELGQLKEGKVLFSQDIDELQRLTKRIADIYINMIERVQLAELEEKNKENSVIEQLKTENDQLKEELEKSKAQEIEFEKIKESLGLINEENKKVQEEQRTLKELNELLKQKNVQLEKTVVEISSEITENEKAIKELNDLKQELGIKTTDIQRLELMIETLNYEKIQLKQQFEAKIIEIDEKTNEQKELEKRQQKIELQELELNLKMDYAKQLDSLKEKHNESLLNLSQRKDELEAIVNEKLIKEINTTK